MLLSKSIHEYEAPPAAPLPKAPSPSAALLSEWQFGLQLLRLGFSTFGLRKLPRGNKAPIILLPGYLAPEWTMEPMRRYLNWLGYDAHHWTLGINQGNPERDHELMVPQVATLAAASGQPVALVGWSLGGTIAREVARIRPDIVSKVVTYGTPVIGGPKFTVGAGVYGEEECNRIANLIDELDQDAPIEVPITAIFTRNDRTVAWPACIDRASKDVKHVEVNSSHASMGVDPDVWRIVAQRLAIN